MSDGWTTTVATKTTFEWSRDGLAVWGDGDKVNIADVREPLGSYGSHHQAVGRRAVNAQCRRRLFGETDYIRGLGRNEAKAVRDALTAWLAGPTTEPDAPKAFNGCDQT